MKEELSINFKKIGIIETPYEKVAPYQPFEKDVNSFKVIIDPEYSEGLERLSSFKYIYLLYFIDKYNGEGDLVFKPDWTREDIDVGIFASRSPGRPNPIGLSITLIKKIEKNIIYTTGLDVFNGTPLLDIKPYIKDLDVKPEANFGWLDELKDKGHFAKHLMGIPHD